jgi:transcriptional regulator with XRE-family HTH domain
MTDRGFGFSQTTIWKIEQGQRPVKVSELIALADAMDILTWSTLLDRPEEASHHRDMELLHRRTGRAYQDLKDAAETFLHAQVELAFAVHQAREAGVQPRQFQTSWLDVPAERAVIEARVEDERDEAIRLQLNEAVDQVIDALRERGYTPLLDPSDIEVSPAANQ